MVVFIDCNIYHRKSTKRNCCLYVIPYFRNEPEPLNNIHICIFACSFSIISAIVEAWRFIFQIDGWSGLQEAVNWCNLTSDSNIVYFYFLLQSSDCLYGTCFNYFNSNGDASTLHRCRKIPSDGCFNHSRNNHLHSNVCLGD